MAALLDALSWIGESLDKPGRALRGALAGRPEALLEAIPFSDTAGWTDPRQSTTGRDLLERWGALQPKEEGEGFGLGDLAGMGVEMVLDPTNLLPTGLIGKGIKAAGKFMRPAQAAGAVADAGTALGRTAGAMARQAADVSPELASAASSTDRGLGLASRFRDLRSRYAGFRDVRPLTPEQFQKYSDALDAGHDLPSGWALTNFPQGPTTQNYIGRIIGKGSSGLHPDELLERHIGQLASELPPQYLAAGIGEYSPSLRTSVQLRATDRPFDPLAGIRTKRHEAIHGLTQEAARAGEYGSLPWISKPAAWLLNKGTFPDPKTGELKLIGNPLTDALAGVSGIIDETAAHALENRRLRQQLGGALDFLFQGPSEYIGLDPGRSRIRSSYAKSFGRTSPLAEMLYRGTGVSPYVLMNLAARGGGSGSLGQELEEP